MTTVPKPASESRTLRFNKWAIVAAVAGAIPTVIELLGDQAVAAAVADLFPSPYRSLFYAVLAVYIAQKNRSLRYETTQPIEQGDTQQSGADPRR